MLVLLCHEKDEPSLAEFEMALLRWLDDRPDDARALLYVALAEKDAGRSQEILLRSAELGNGVAQGMVAIALNSLEWAVRAVAQDDAAGLFYVYEAFSRSIGRGSVKARDCLLRSAELGYSRAVEVLAGQVTPLEGLAMLIDVVHVGQISSFVGVLSVVLANFDANNEGRNALFLAGEFLREKLDESGLLSGEAFFGFGVCERVVQMHDAWCEEERKKCMALVMCMKLWNVPKDVRCMIVRLVWDSRK